MRTTSNTGPTAVRRHSTTLSCCAVGIIAWCTKKAGGSSSANVESWWRSRRDRLAEIHRSSRLSVDLEAEDVRAPVMTGDVHGPLRHAGALGVAVGVQAAVLLGQGAGDDGSVWRHDDRVPRVEPLLQVWEHASALREVGRDVLAAHSGAIAQHPAATFERDMPHRRYPRTAGVPGRRDI